MPSKGSSSSSNRHRGRIGGSSGSGLVHSDVSILRKVEITKGQLSQGQKGLLRELDTIFQSYDNFSVHKVFESSKKKGEDYSGTTTKMIVAGSGHMIKGILWCGDVIVETLKWKNEHALLSFLLEQKRRNCRGKGGLSAAGKRREGGGALAPVGFSTAVAAEPIHREGEFASERERELHLRRRPAVLRPVITGSSPLSPWRPNTSSSLPPPWSPPSDPTRRKRGVPSASCREGLAAAVASRRRHLYRTSPPYALWPPTAPSPVALALPSLLWLVLSPETHHRWRKGESQRRRVTPEKNRRGVVPAAAPSSCQEPHRRSWGCAGKLLPPKNLAAVAGRSCRFSCHCRSLSPLPPGMAPGAAAKPVRRLPLFRFSRSFFSSSC
ncbi:uncharacterized protein [Arachis hypogaea]|uniref:uncharacterized protein n=1 Tax=Arachis hypogaea TaxID=3818 RepID=UPI003B2141E7